MSSTSWLFQRSNVTKLSNLSYQHEANSSEYYYQIPVLILLEFIGIMGNTLAIVMTIKMLRYKGNLPQVLILYLSLVDLLSVLCSYTPSLIAKFFLIPNKMFHPNHWLCQFQAFTMMTLLYYSSGMIVIMSIERLLAIKMPVWYKVNFKPKTIYIAMAITLLCSMLFNFLPLFGLCQLSIHFKSTCFWDWNLTNPGTKFYSYTVALLSIILVVTLFIINIITIMAVKRKNKIADIRRRKPITENQATRVLISTGFLFVICWLPFSVIILLHQTGRTKNMDSSQVELMDYVTFRLTCLTCCMNCFIYGLINKEHRHRYLMLIKRPFQLCNNMTTEEYENAFKPSASKQSNQISAQIQMFRATAIMLAASRTRMNRVANKYYQNAMANYS